MRRVTIILNVNFKIVKSTLLQVPFSRRFGNAALLRVQKFVIGHVSYVI